MLSGFRTAGSGNGPRKGIVAVASLLGIVIFLFLRDSFCIYIHAVSTETVLRTSATIHPSHPTSSPHRIPSPTKFLTLTHSLKSAQIQRHTTSPPSPIPLWPAAKLPRHRQRLVRLEFEAVVLDGESRATTACACVAGAAGERRRAAICESVG